MELKALDVIVCRTPAFSVEDRLDEKWAELQTLIRESSPTLFEIIKDLDYVHLRTADKKINYSVWKYFNRAKFRATPFGCFAGFSAINIENGHHSNLVLNQQLNSTNLIDWSAKDDQISDLQKVIKNTDYLQTNSSIYRVESELRYIRFKNGRFEIGSVTTFPELVTILKHCRNKIRKRDLYLVLQSDHQLCIRDVDTLLKQILALQLVLGDRLPNITGEDFFKRLHVKKNKSHSTYALAERKIVSGGFDLNRVSNIPDLIRFMQINLPTTENQALCNFKNAFLKKFEQGAIPLLVAMDPELGVGYSDLAQPAEDLDLIDLINQTKQVPPSGHQINYTQLHHFLLESMLSGGNIRLDEFKNQSNGTSLPLPNSLSVILRLYNGQPVIETMSGCTANALTGRFTVASQELTLCARKIAGLEAKANADVLFFDIAYQAEKNVDNVNRREHLYAYELPILTWSCHENTLCLDDILVAVRDSEVILWSKKYARRLIPRIPSAYNYGRSDLSVYRFLCDLQHQGVKSELNLNLQQYFPGLAHYPRVTYKDIIVSPAMWRLPDDLVTLSKSDKTDSALSQLRTWLQEKGIDFNIRAGKSDQKLCFNPKEDSDLGALLSYRRQNLSGEVYIAEALLSDHSEVSDTKGKPYLAEYILNYAHDNRVYHGHNLIDNEQAKTLSSSILPGREWLYFEIYCHPSRSNGILLNQIEGFLKDSAAQISKWFFVRYDDPKPHLRLRLHLPETSQGYQIINKLNSFLEHDSHSGLISDIQIKAYSREIERYGAARMDFVEAFFFIDSVNVKTILAKRYSTVQLYQVTLSLIQRLLQWCFSDIRQELGFAMLMANNFKDEFKLESQTFKKINQSFQEYKQATNTSPIQPFPYVSSSYKKTLHDILDSCDSSERTKMMADLFHMHINRLFDSHQRTHEAIIYQYLVKILKAKQGVSATRQVYPLEP